MEVRDKDKIAYGREFMNQHSIVPLHRTGLACWDRILFVERLVEFAPGSEVPPPPSERVLTQMQVMPHTGEKFWGQTIVVGLATNRMHIPFEDTLKTPGP